MKTKRVVVLAVIALAGIAAALSTRTTRTVAAPPPSTVNADIALFERRATEDPQSAADRSQLAGLYLQRGRETGEYADFQRAEKFARAALNLRTERNGKGKLILASSLLAQHRFADARAAAGALVADDPQSIGHRALLAEILLELGDYPAADAEFNALTPFSENLALAPRLARWHELHGRNEQAHELLVNALEQTRTRPDLPAEQVAWFHLRVADYALRNGLRREAERTLENGLARAPGDYRLHAAYARYFAALRDWTEVLREVDIVGERADLATLALAGDAAHQLGDELRARAYYDRVAYNARSKPEPFARQWTQFCLEHGVEPELTLQTLRAESLERHDVLGYELLAWAEHKAGNTVAANRALDSALRLGTRDALLHFIAAQVRLGTSDRAAAGTHLRTALEINPQFHPILADSARRLSQRLGNWPTPAGHGVQKAAFRR
jgi:tetratricopeptide (TPR) repeat protein